MKAKLIVLALAAITASCASTATVPETTPSPAAEVTAAPPASAPAWVKTPSLEEGAKIIFVVTGAENAVVADLAYQAMADYLDLAPNPDAPAANRAVEKFLKEQSSTAPAEKYLKSGRGWWRVTVSKEVWDRTRTELKALYDAETDPSVALERNSDSLLQKGQYVEALNGYIAAAVILVDKASPRLRSVLEKAETVLTQFSITTTTPPQSTQVGQPFPASFDVKVNYGAGVEAPVAGLNLRFSFKTKTNGRVAMTGVSLTTDSQGQAHFLYPTPSFAAQDNVVVLFDVNPWMEALVHAPQDVREEVTAFEDIASLRKLQIPYTVESTARLVPLIVALADFDEKGSVRPRQETTPALIAALQKAGFQTSGLPVNPTLLKSPNESVILAAWKFQGKKTGRAVYGTTNVVAVTSSGSQFAAEVAGSLKVVDLATNQLVYQLKSSKIVTAGDRATATTLALRQWAAEAVDTLAAELP